jgi:8-oxo-dGTP pyrophosphatase MutT (NUDIX family)
MNKLLPVGGHVELTETPWQALARELKEESGYEISQLAILQPKSRIKNLTDAVLHPYPISINTHNITDKHFHTVIEYAFVANSEPNHDIKEGESTDQRWLTIDEIMALPDDIIFENVKEVYAFMINEALTQWERVDTDDYSL